MKKIVTEEAGEGFEKFLGEKITIYCDSFIYSGILTGINDICLLLDGAEIVYSTGSHDSINWETSEKMPNKSWYVMIQKIESFGKFK